MTTAFQHVFDRATALVYNNRKRVSQTVARDGTVRTTSMGDQRFLFEVQLPDGVSWLEYRPLIAEIQQLDRVTNGTVQITNPELQWMVGYQGAVAQSLSPIEITVNNAVATVSNSASLLKAPGISLNNSDLILRRGDFIQLDNGSVYTVGNDVTKVNTTVSLNKPIIESDDTYTVKTGSNVVWTLTCTSFPNWRFVEQDRIAWDGAFTFVEVI